MKTVTVNVTAKNIACGLARNCSRCPVANAVREVVARGTRLEVDGENVSLWPNHLSQLDARDNDMLQVIELPSKIKNEIYHYDIDDKKTMKPLSFRLKIDKKFLPLS